MKTLIIATRSSELALRQATQVQRLLDARGVASELRTYKTVGDKRLDQPLASIGAKGLFTQELETDLANGDVHCCVHSLKDLPTEMPAGLELVSLLTREDPRDVLVVNASVTARSIAELPAGTRVGTSSLRRRAQLHALRPDLEINDLRGNVPTRVRKVDDRVVDVAILAAAGLHRLGMHDRIAAYLEAPAWLPAAGQGAIAIQIRSDDPATRAVLAPLGDDKTLIETTAERSFLAGLEGGCQVPIGAAAIGGTLYGFISDVAGEQVVRGEIAIDSFNPAASGQALAGELRGRGAEAILTQLRRESGVTAPQPE